ncbi:nuclear transport factor 2 family protein [Sphingobacterium faecium]
MRKVLLFIGLNLLLLHVNAQTDEGTNDWHLVQKTLLLYMDGIGTSDSVKVSQSFHDSWQLKYLEDDKINIIKKPKYMERFDIAPHAKSPKWSGRIVFIDITHTVAVAKVEISTAKLLFTDYFNLMKTSEGWFIVDKISTRSPHRTVEIPANPST